MSVTVLYVDSDPDDRTATVAALTDAGQEVVTVDGVGAARDRLSTAVDCVVTEYDLPDGTGLDILGTVRAEMPDTPCVLYTDASPADIDTSMFEGLVAEYLPKRDGENAGRLRTMVDEFVTQRSQVGYPLPDDESARLAALEEYDVETAGTEAMCDRLTELAVQYVDVDKVFIGVVEDSEEQFIACQGGDPDPLERENTMCTHAILQEDLMVVEDTRDDDRFEHNDALERLDIRAYVGAPLRTADGLAIGSFCLTDDEPRTFSDDELRVLRLLADEAEEQLTLRRRLQDGEEGAP